MRKYYYIIFKNEQNEDFILHNGAFVGFENERQALGYIASTHLLSLLGAKIVPISMEDLTVAVGGIGYFVYDIFNKLGKVQGVKIDMEYLNIAS